MIHEETPTVSVLMANRNGGRHIGAAVRSVLGQTLGSLELILADDGSTDDSLDRALEAAAGDPRLTVIPSEVSQGPGAARNRAFAAARGRWIAIVDSDDLIQRDRLERLVAAAEADEADMVADNLLVFDDDGRRRPRLHLTRRRWGEPRWISFEEFVRSSRLAGGEPSLEVLKPLVRRTRMARIEGPYAEDRRLGEDFDLLLRLMANGARLRVYPEPGYLRRRHAGARSDQIDIPGLQALIDGDKAFLHSRWLDPPDLESLRQRRKSLEARIGAELIKAALGRRDVGEAARLALRRPAALGVLGRRAPRFPARRAASGRPSVFLLSRQRIVGATNGSSAYVLSLAGALKAAGYAVHYVGASPKIFGRWPVLRLKPETDVFASYRVAGGVRAGRLVIAADPKVFTSAAATLAEKVLAKLRLKRAGWVKPAPYAVAAAPTPDDALYVAQAGFELGPSAAVVCDYAFLAPLAPFALQAEAPVLTVMHDLFSSRGEQFAKVGAADSVASLTAEAEFRLLACADVVAAIQSEEADEVRRRLPSVRVVTAPMAVEVGAPQPGRSDRVLFVGSNTAPNTVGLAWFLTEVWPAIRAQRPDAQLEVAGSVARGLGETPIPDGVSLLGVVDRLEPLYERAGVVISPLLTGSGLKIKVVEALGAGKAVVGTRVSAQGVEDIVREAMIVEDDPARFAQAVSVLLASEARRAELCARAVDCARRHFGAERCYAGFVEAVRTGLTAPARPRVPAAQA